MWRPDLPLGSDAVPALLRALLESDTVHVPAEVADELTELRSRRPTIAWFGINERRVDAVIDTDDDQFRLVYFTDDGASVDDIALYRRPPPLEELAGGQVVVVNGPSGSGKSTVMAALAERSRFPWVLFDEPVIGSVGQPYLIWRDQAPHLHRGFLRAIAELARSGNRVALSAAGHPPALLDEVFSNVPTLRVGLDCDLPTLLRREQGRDGVGAASSRPHAMCTTAGSTTSDSTPPHSPQPTSSTRSCATPTEPRAGVRERGLAGCSPSIVGCVGDQI